MATLEDGTPFDEILKFLASAPTPEQIIEFHPSERFQLRLRDLLDGNRNGVLNGYENNEPDEFSRMIIS